MSADFDFAFGSTTWSPRRYAAAPQLTARVQIEESLWGRMHAIALRCQVSIEPQRRAYDPEETVGLLTSSAPGTAGRKRSSRSPWMQCSAMVQGFTGSTMIELPMPVTYDFEVTASKYLHQLDDGEVPLRFMFSGTCFTRGESGFGVEQVPWHLEDAYRMPVAVWRDMHESALSGHRLAAARPRHVRCPDPLQGRARPDDLGLGRGPPAREAGCAP